MDMTDKVVLAVDTGLDGLDYVHKRDVRLTLIIEGDQAVWLAVQDGTDEFDVSDPFPAKAGDEEWSLLSRYHREQAFLAVKLGHAVTIEEAAASVAAYDVAKASKGKKSSKKVAA
jgi:hypothetical protein